MGDGERFLTDNGCMPGVTTWGVVELRVDLAGASALKDSGVGEGRAGTVVRKMRD
jgi:hypothetical protein